MPDWSVRRRTNPSTQLVDTLFASGKRRLWRAQALLAPLDRYKAEAGLQHSRAGGNPDFVRLAESYGAVGFRTHLPREVSAILQEALKIKDKPVVLDFAVAQEENVFPMVPAGASLVEMVDGENY